MSGLRGQVALRQQKKEVRVRQTASDDTPTAAELPKPVSALALRRPARPWRRFVVKLVALALIWAVLTDFRPDALVFGLPAVIAAAALVFVLPAAPGWRLSPRGALEFALWFAVQTVRGAVDVAARAFAPRMPLAPGFRAYAPNLPDGAPRIVFLNTITLLPGTLSAEVAGAQVIVHMLDTEADLDSDMHALERRIAALFGLTLSNEVAQ